MGVLALLILPVLAVGIAGIVYIYKQIMRLMSKSAVRNKVVVITDAVSGLGKECSRVFHSGGGRVVLCGNDWDKLEALQEALLAVADPSQTFSPKIVLLDLSETESIPEKAKEILESFGCVDVLINNSSLKVKGAALNVPFEMDKKIMDANYFGPISLTKELLPSMIARHNGQIVLINSIQGKLGLPFRAAYAASKHALQAFFDCLRAEVSEYGITVSTVSPTFIRSYHQMPETGNWEASIWKCRKLNNHPSVDTFWRSRFRMLHDHWTKCVNVEGTMLKNKCARFSKIDSYLRPRTYQSSLIKEQCRQR
ncbi:dehydrogenase/reductase (SDR family) member 7Cb isoform X2 [Hypanus sabinus]|uniref:dehydrogenase/reductase (SDR family) member 7Cb isoform X2 n=1 Tax=Hypanus sabinus TaxID=79690 RepID=UPI0028C4BD95|nr:dehydrogenase/reductase (SDR family) member 7Cb isoform X2 [Hypanus sabinus]